MSWSVILFLGFVVIAFALVFYFSLPELDQKQDRLNKKIERSVHNLDGGGRISDYIKLLSEPTKDYPEILYLGWKNKLTGESEK